MDLSIEINNLQINAQEEDADSNTPAETTLFPKISGKVPELVRNYVYAHRIPPASPEDKIVTIAPGTPNLVSMTGTVKLHGTHADIVVYHDNTIRLQSRNRLSLDVEMDNYGVAGHLLPLRASMLALRDRILARFKELNPTSEVLEQHPVIIAGEWVGPGVQKGVALAKLKSKYFVVISVAINDKWVPDEPYSDIEDIEAGIVHVSRGGFFHEVLNIDDPGPCQQKMMDLTLAVEKECPFSKSFGISGVGEGIVWKAAHPLGEDARFWLKTKGPLQQKFWNLWGEDARFWLKTKGPLHRVSNTDDLKKVPPDTDEREKAKSFAEAAVTDMRLQQGWDYLGEMRIERNAKAVPRMMKWVCDDVMLEEKGVIEELGVDRQALRKAIGSISRDWFLQKLMGDYTK